MTEVLDKNLDKLNKLMGVLNEDYFTKEEFFNAFKNVIDLVVKIEKRNSEAVQKIEETYHNLLNKFNNDYSSNLTDLKKQTNELFVGKQIEKMIKEHTERMNASLNKIKEINEKISEIKDGYTPIKGKDYFDGRDGRFITDEELNQKINNQMNPIIDIFRKNWENKVQEVLSKRGIGVGGGRISQIIPETPSGALNGSNTTFTLTTNPKNNSLLLLLNGQGQRQGSDKEYTLAGKTITMNVAPLSTDTIFAYYTKF